MINPYGLTRKIIQENCEFLDLYGNKECGGPDGFCHGLCGQHPALLVFCHACFLFENQDVYSELTYRLADLDEFFLEVQDIEEK